MAKIKKAFFCSNCGAQSPVWSGQCHSCNEWNTLNEEIISKPTAQEEKKSVWKEPSANKAITAKRINEIHSGKTERLITDDPELNRVLGGGIVMGSLILVGGQPGIGKSTLILQTSLALKEQVLYVSGEESEEQIKMRAMRVSPDESSCLILTDININNILKVAQKVQPALLVIDSIQTISSPFIESTPGSVSQIRECTGELQRFAKETGIPVIIIGHITKDGSIAGPKLLEHIVDVVLQFEGDQNYIYRILRTLKNRFGSTDELGIYEMKATGMRPVENPSEMLLSQSEELLSGSAVAATIEGLRPMLIETQALVSPSVYGTPQRSATGFDLRRMSMLLAVLEKRCGLAFGQSDVFLNIAGGIKISDPSIDLAVAASLISSLENEPVNRKMCFAGEVGLSGEIRAVSRIDQRIQEADRLGFEKIIVAKNNLKGLDINRYDIEIEGISKLDDLLRSVFT